MQEYGLSKLSMLKEKLEIRRNLYELYDSLIPMLESESGHFYDAESVSSSQIGVQNNVIFSQILTFSNNKMAH